MTMIWMDALDGWYNRGEEGDETTIQQLTLCLRMANSTDTYALRAVVGHDGGVGEQGGGGVGGKLRGRCSVV
jgi:hypothetical protein